MGGIRRGFLEFLANEGYVSVSSVSEFNNPVYINDLSSVIEKLAIMEKEDKIDGFAVVPYDGIIERNSIEEKYYNVYVKLKK